MYLMYSKFIVLIWRLGQVPDFPLSYVSDACKEISNHELSTMSDVLCGSEKWSLTFNEERRLRVKNTSSGVCRHVILQIYTISQQLAAFNSRVVYEGKNSRHPSTYLHGIRSQKTTTLIPPCDPTFHMN